MKYYVYAHIRLDSNEIFYIGKGSENRAFSYLNRNSYWHNIVNAFDYRVEILKSDMSEKEAFCEEVRFITEHKPIANFTIGGTGGDTFSKLPEFKKEEIRDKARTRAIQPNSGIAKAAKLRKGKTKDTDSGLLCMAEHHSIAFSGEGNPMYGKSHWNNSTDEQKEDIKKRISETLKQTHKEKPRTYEIITCPHCNKSGGSPGLTRYHFNNCKNKK